MRGQEPPQPTFAESFEGDLEEVSAEELVPKDDSQAAHIERVAGVRGKAVRFSGDRGVFFRDCFDVDRWDALSLDFWLRDTERSPDQVVVLQKTRGTDVGYNGFDVMLSGGMIDVRMYRVWPGNGFGVRAAEPLAKDRWTHLTVTYDGSSQAAGLRLYVDGKVVPTTVLRDRIHKSAVAPGNGKGYLTLGERFRDRGFKGGEIDELRVFDRVLAPLEIQNLQDGQSLEAAIVDPQHHLRGSAGLLCRGGGCRRAGPAGGIARGAPETGRKWKKEFKKCR